MILKLNQKFQHQFKVDESTYNSFLHIFDDWNSLHVDDEFARSKGFKAKVMHGNILNGFLSYFIGELLPSEEVMIISQSINYKNPVYLDDILNFEAVVADQSEAVKVNTFKFRFINTDNKIVASGKIHIKELT
ncbi:acyl dehydratase [Chryseobacterium defluvii]|uniref:Acyl dehydratase n=1 Tax=Chryseobacterium defluvii TaxID=160396 RepID=A0A840KB25_9FLAO|nr:MaoC/PaaZ C-terminal domain-containing protein [Chryseobacterium defluvii]MBB4806619.1 acyl dehydratase [Chryseobacterium defluvii]